jgi:DNA-binding MarR family transcriptional regulator
MKTSIESEITIVKLWRQLYQTYTLLKQCEDRVIEEHGLTTEQFAVLGAMDYFVGPMNITDLARWLERSTNSITMLVDRMVKAGLVRRVRSKRDRRVVSVTFTSKGKMPLNRQLRQALRLSGRSCRNYHMRTGITFLVCWGRQNMRY